MARLADDADDDPVEDRGGARDDVEVPERDRVVAPGADRGSVVVGSCVLEDASARTEPYLRLVRSASGSSGCSLRGGLDDDEPVLGEERRQVVGQGWQEGVEHPVGRVDEDEIVPPARGRLGGESAARVAS